MRIPERWRNLGRPSKKRPIRWCRATRLTFAPAVAINVSGSAVGGYVTFQNYPGEMPILDSATLTPPQNADAALFLLNGRSYVSILGFELRSYKSASTSRTPAGILLRGARQHVQIRNCNVHDIWNTAGNTTTVGNAFGIAIYGSSTTPATDITIDGCEVHHLKTGASEAVVLNGNVTSSAVTNNRVHDNNNIGIDFIGFEGTCPDSAQAQARAGSGITRRARASLRGKARACRMYTGCLVIRN